MTNPPENLPDQFQIHYDDGVVCVSPGPAAEVGDADATTIQGGVL